MDAMRRYLLVSKVTTGHGGEEAQMVFGTARRLAGKKPSEVVTDGLPDHVEAFESTSVRAPRNAFRSTPRKSN